ncbi:MAG: sigma-70 family RNA polymerase sigma factor [bacterium]
MDAATAKREKLERLVRTAATGDADAVTALVTQFQDRAWAAAYSQLRDAQLAEDAAQEAFVDALLHLDQLRVPAAFPRWLARVVAKHCDRLRRRRRVPTVALTDADAVPADGADPFALAADDQARDRLHAAVERLPAGERTAILMTYLGEQTAAEAADALGLPLTTVKKRLHSARRRLAGEVLDLLGDSIAYERPSRDERFSTRVQLFLAIRSGQAEPAAQLLDAHPELLDAQEEWEIDPAIAETLPFPLRATPLIRAAEQGDVALVEILLSRGADPNRRCGCMGQETALFAAIVTNRDEMTRILLAAGADPNLAAFSNHTPLHVAAMRGYSALVTRLLASGADCEARDQQGRTPLDWARIKDQHATIRLLADRVTLAAADAGPAAESGAQQEQILGRVFDGYGRPTDGDPQILARPAARRAVRATPEPTPWWTGIKVIDLFAPLSSGAAMQLLGERGRGGGYMPLLSELAFRAGAGGAVWAGWEHLGYERNDTLTGLRETITADRSVVVYAGRDAAKAERAEVATTAAALARYLREHATQPVLTIALEPDDERAVLSDLAEFTTIVGVPPPQSLPQWVPHYSARLLLDPRLGALRCYPTIDPITSTSRWSTPAGVGERHHRVAEAARALLRSLRPAATDAPLADPTQIDASHPLRRAWRMQAYLTQPFHTTEAFSGRLGSTVPLQRLLDDVEAILAGAVDEVPLPALFYLGDLDGVRAATA